MMSQLNVGSLVAMLVGAFVAMPSATYADDAKLESIKIQYKTTKDDKNSGTKLWTYVKIGGDTIGSLEKYADNTKFDNNSNSSDYFLMSIDKSITKSQVKKGVRAQIKMETKDGDDDNWWFKFTLTFAFADGTTVTMDSNETRFDDDEKVEETFELKPN